MAANESSELRTPTLPSNARLRKQIIGVDLTSLKANIGEAGSAPADWSYSCTIDGTHISNMYLTYDGY